MRLTIVHSNGLKFAAERSTLGGVVDVNSNLRWDTKECKVVVKNGDEYPLQDLLETGLIAVSPVTDKMSWLKYWARDIEVQAEPVSLQFVELSNGDDSLLVSIPLFLEWRKTRSIPSQLQTHETFLETGHLTEHDTNGAG